MGFRASSHDLNFGLRSDLKYRFQSETWDLVLNLKAGFRLKAQFLIEIQNYSLDLNFGSARGFDLNDCVLNLLRSDGSYREMRIDFVKEINNIASKNSKSRPSSRG